MRQIYVDGRDCVIFYGSPVGYVKDTAAICDPMFRTDELCAFLEKHGYLTSWKDGIFEKLINGESISENEEKQAEMLKGVRILRLKSSASTWADLATLGKKLPEPTLSDYAVIFDGEADSNDLEQIYEQHRLSLADMVELYDEDGSAYYYLDRTCFRQVHF